MSNRFQTALVRSPFDVKLPPQPHQAFLNMRDATGGFPLAARRAVEAMWLPFRHRATNHWLSQFPREPHQRFWEMYLALVLEADGHRLDMPHTARRDEGPDVKLLRDGLPSVVVEAVCATLGDPASPNCVPSFPTSTVDKIEVHMYPEEQVVLRIASVLADKAKQRQRHVASGLVDPASPFVIALNCGGHRELSCGAVEPMALKALFPVGHPSLSIDTRTFRTVDSGWTTRMAVTKTQVESGAGVAIPTTMFANPAASAISAILCSNANLANHAWLDGGRPSHGFSLVRNPFAAHPVPPNLLPVDEVIDAVLAGGDMLEIHREPGRAPMLSLSKS